MNEDIEQATKIINSHIERWQDGEHTFSLATLIEFDMTALKLLIGIRNFDELPAYCRVLKQVSAWLNEYEKKEVQS